MTLTSALALAVVASLASTAAAADAASDARAASRVYVAKLRGAEGVEASAATALEEAVLVAAKKARPDMTVIGRGDVAMLADLRAEQEAAGCDAESCAAEIADALGAPQIVTGKLSRVGSTWILSLTRLERGTLLVLARESVERQGSSPEVLVGEIPKLVNAVFADEAAHRSDDERPRDDDARPPSTREGVSGLAIGGGVGLGAGVVALAGGAALVGWSLVLYEEARQADERGDDAEVARKRDLGEPVYVGGLALVGAGALVGLVSGIALGIGLAE